MDAGQRIAIVGAGIWGLSACRALQEAGSRDVTVFERDAPGSGASAYAAGLFSTHLRLASDIRLVRESREILSALRNEGEAEGIASAAHVFHRTGGLTVAGREKRDRLEALEKRVRGAGETVERIDGRELERRWNLGHATDLSGLHSPQDGHVEPGDLVDLLARRVRGEGARVESATEVHLSIEHGMCGGVRANGSVRRFDRVILAAGAWGKAILQEAGLRIPLKPYRTQLAQLEYAPPPGFPVFHDTAQGFYTRPDGSHRMLAGDGTEHVESRPESFRRGVDPEFIEKMARCVVHRFPGGGQAAYRTGWAGLCVATPDREPLIGPYPGVEGLDLMVGDNGFGLMRGLALGRVAARAVLQRDRVPAYRPERLDFEADFEIREGFEL